MIVDVSSVLKEFGGRVSFDGKAELAEINFSGSGYRFKEPLTVRGSVFNSGGGALALNADAAGVIITQCARCMKDIEVPIEFGISETLMRSDEDVPEDEDIIVFEGSAVELDEIVENNFIMNLEPRYLCREDCKGLCPVCGADLNEGECGCAGVDIDPRWAALADMIKNED